MEIRAKEALLKPDASIKEAMEVIKSATIRAPNAPGHIALVVNKNNKLTGIVTDGDIRKALLGGADINAKIDKFINKNPITFNKDLTHEEMLEKTIEEIKKRSKKRLDIVITVDENNCPNDIFPFFELWQKTEIKARTISIVGLGYVGLTLGLVLADSGFKVIGVDKNRKVVADLNCKKIHIYEQGIDALLSRHLNKNFFVQHSFKKNDSDVYIICVGTPIDKNGGVIIEPLKEALLYITNLLKKDDLVILRSTIPAGTCRNFAIPFLKKQTGLKAGEDFYVSFAPERTVEGNALKELRSLPQIIGGYDKKSVDLTVKIFKNLTNSIVLVDNLEAAEMVKLLNNAYRDLTFSFANETALICDKFNLNSHKVIKAANYGYERSFIPQPGPGVGGYCLTKDPYILADSARSMGHKALLPLLSRKINNQMTDYICNKVDCFIENNKKDKMKAKIFVAGLAFKGEPETSDMRESTSLAIINELQKKYKNIVVYDPVVKREEVLRRGLKHTTLKRGFRGSDCVLILNNHKSFRDLDIFPLLALMKKQGLFFDAWHLYDDVLTESINGVAHCGI